jgi:hypothetical protein
MKQLLARLALLTLVTNVHAGYEDLESAKNSPEKKLVIGYHAFGAGFFSGFFGVLNCISWCEKNGKIPVVFWGKEDHLPPHPYYVDEGYNGTKNSWEFYFEPVSYLQYVSGDEVIYHYFVPEATLINSGSGLSRETLNKAYKLKVNAFINKYVKIKKPILEKVDAFFSKHMKGKTTIGIHIRGTDKYTEVEPINPQTLFDAANKYAADFKECQFFVATDEERLLILAKAKLNGPVISYDAVRSKSDMPLHLCSHNYNKAVHGEEVLIEALLLSKCDLFLHTSSNVSAAVTLFNPHLKNIYFIAGEKEPLVSEL